jgi:hypothetical protein
MLQHQRSLFTITIPSCRVGRELHCSWFGSDGRQETSTWPQAIPFPYNQSVKASLVLKSKPIQATYYGMGHLAIQQPNIAKNKIQK